MLSGVFFYNDRADLILGRFYKDDISRVTSEAFRVSVLVPKDFSTPVMMVDKATFMYIRVENIYVVASTGQNANPIMVFELLYTLVDTLRAYFKGKFDEASFRGNFTLIYELLDEMVDHGYPQIVSPELLQEYIKVASVDQSWKEKLKGARLRRKHKQQVRTDPNRITNAITGSVDWRQPKKYSYKKNEVYLDVLEDINVLMSPRGDVLQMNATGQVVMNTLLSGMPECRIGINDKLSLDPNRKETKTAYIKFNDIKLHRCVRLGKFDEDRSIVFIPPDGEYELMRYTVQNVNVPFVILPNVIERGRNRVEYEIKLESKFNPHMYSSDIIVYIPCPNNTNKTNVKVTLGKCKYEPVRNALAWKIKKMFGNQVASLKGEVQLTALIQDKKWSRPPIDMKFEVRMFAASGIKIRYLKVIEHTQGYKTTKWVRYITRAGNYQIRI